MMILRAALILGGIFYLLIGTGFLIDPVRLGGTFGVTAAGAQGLSSLRADFTAFFWLLGASLVWGAARRSSGALLVAALLIGIALTGRAVSLLIDGNYPAAFQPMTVEALTLVLALAGIRMLAARRG